jgi:hypothetical protein
MYSPTDLTDRATIARHNTSFTVPLHNEVPSNYHIHHPSMPPRTATQVLQVMDPPRRRVVIFKGGGYVYADMESMIQSAGAQQIQAPG